MRDNRNGAQCAPYFEEQAITNENLLQNKNINLKGGIKNMNKKFKNQSGITLIALIITIIILVILAAVSIRAVYNMGIVGHAINGTQQYAEGAVAENRMFGDIGSFIDNAVSKIKEIQAGEGIALNKSKMGLQLISGQTVSEKLTATLLKITGNIEWTTSNPEVATVGNDGTVTAVAVGKTTITAKVTSNEKEYSASCEVEVTTEPVTNVELNVNTGTLDIGQTLTLTATVTPSTASNQGVTWSSSDTNVATVENGVVTAVGAGSATITATANDGSGYNATCAITVNPRLVSSITLNETTKTLNVGETLTLSATVAPNDATNKNVTWSSSDSSVAEVAQDGKVTAKGAGTATITATAADGSGKTGTCSVTVNAPVVSGSTGPTGKPLVNSETVSDYVTGSTPLEGEDRYGNPITIPVGFKVAADSGDDVTQGIVIEDNDVQTDGNGNQRGNQYVWIPTGTIYTDTAMTPANAKTIIAGRYEFANGTRNYTNEAGETVTEPVKGTPILKQSLTNYVNTVTIASFYQELSTYREGVVSLGTDGLNRTAKNLKGFADSVVDNHGYYIARYEASWGTGDKVKSRVSSGTPAVSTPSSRTNGQLWNYVTEIEAAGFCQNIQNQYSGLNSDLMNSYAWDTAIVFMQTFDDRADKTTPYSYQSSRNTSGPNNTGVNNDEVCKINDMASNCFEWTTEYSTNRNSSSAYPYVVRGGYYNNSTRYYTAYRNNYNATNSGSSTAFRPTLYL